MTAIYQDPSQPIAARVSDLIAQMTLAEKVGQMIQLPALGDDYESYIERYHIGSYLHCMGEKAVRLQALNNEKSRLKIPLIYGIDAIHGHCFEDEMTVFPVQLAQACSWHPPLAKAIGEITAREARSGGLHWTFSPVLCMGRDPRWGRTSETFGEDTLLVSDFAAATTEGYQNGEWPMAACAKHYAVYGEARGGRDSTDVHTSEREMRNIFLPSFERQARMGCKTFMVGYQSINGIPCSANTWLMNDVLRDEWGFEGVAVTDWNNVGQMLTLQKAAPNLKEALAQCLEASNDIFMMTPEVFEHMQELVAEGRVSEARIDESVTRILRLKFELGLFDNYEIPDRAQLLQDDTRWQLAEEAAEQTLTLVRNNGVLPLNAKEPAKILLVGDNASSVFNTLGDWSFVPGGPTGPQDIKHTKATITLVKALENYAGNFTLNYAASDDCSPVKNQVPSNALREQANNADIIIACLGDDLKQHGEYHDRADLNLTGNQQQAFDILAASGKPVISVLLASKPHTINSVIEQSAAVLIAFHPGAKAGSAITRCLFGDINPAGRLPITFPRHVGQLPAYYNQAPGWHSVISPFYDKKERYIDLPETPLLAFGEGMSFSNIEYGKGECTEQNGTVSIRVNVKNTSDRDAIEVVQLYARLCIAGVTSPNKQLLQYQRVSIAANSSVTVEFTIEQSSLMVWDKQLQKEAYTGEAVFMVGKSSLDADLEQFVVSFK